MSTIAALGRALERDPRWLTGESDDPAAPVERATPGLPILHRISAGVYRERDGGVIGIGPAAPTPVYGNFPQWWEVLEGDSADLIFPPGALVRVVDAQAMQYKPRDRDLVVIERERAGLVERTVREIVMGDGGHIIARARTRNPRHAADLTLNDDPTSEGRARVVGLVLDAYIGRG